MNMFFEFKDALITPPLLGSILGGFVTGYATNYYLNMSLFLAIAVLYGEMQLNLFMVLPQIRSSDSPSQL